MKYISIGIIMLISFIISVVITKVEIPVLKRKAGQNIREDGPQSHLSKAGTPSMGGIAIIIADLKAGMRWFCSEDQKPFINKKAGSIGDMCVVFGRRLWKNDRKQHSGA